MRLLLVRLHRWFGLTAALFLTLAGLSGAVLSWDHEIDEALNPTLFHSTTAGTPQSALALIARVESIEPHAVVTGAPLHAETGRAFLVSVAPRVDPSRGEPFELAFDQVALDPVSGNVQGRRDTSAMSLAPASFIPFLHRFHYSLQLPDTFDLEIGTLWMGLISIAWVIDTLVALWISFPSWRAWRRSIAFRLRASNPKLTFDLHRSGGVWLHLLLLATAITSIGLNLPDDVMRPLVATLSPLTPSPFDGRDPLAPAKRVAPAVNAARVIELARAEAERRGITAPAGGLYFSPAFGLWGVGFFAPADRDSDRFPGNAWLYFDGATGTPAGNVLPGRGSAGDTFMQAMRPIHTGRIIGTAGQVLVSLMGVAVATLSITGVLLWARKRRARALATTLNPQRHREADAPA